MLYRLYFSLWASEAEAREVRPSDVEIVPSSAKAPVYNELHIISVEAIHEILFIFSGSCVQAAHFSKNLYLCK